MVTLIIIGGTIGYIFFSAIYYIIGEKIDISGEFLAATCWIWPVAFPIMLLILLGVFFYDLLTGKLKN